MIALIILQTLAYFYFGAYIMRRGLWEPFIVAVIAALVPYALVGNGVPLWRSAPFGDAYDWGVVVYLLICCVRRQDL